MLESIDDQIEMCHDDDLLQAYDHELAYGEEMMRQGMTQGFEQGQANIIKSMLENKMTLEEISTITKLSIETINNLLKNASL